MIQFQRLPSLSDPQAAGRLLKDQGAGDERSICISQNRLYVIITRKLNIPFPVANRERILSRVASVFPFLKIASSEVRPLWDDTQFSVDSVLFVTVTL